MQKLLELLLNRRDDSGRAMACIEAANATGEINVAVAIDIFENRALGSCKIDGRPLRQAARNRCSATVAKRFGLRSRNFRL